MEKIHKRALRVVFNDYESSYMDLLKKANRPPLYVSRMKTIGVEMYKCPHQLNPTFVSYMFSVPERMYNLRRGSQFVQPNVNTTTFGLNTLRYEGARIRNMIPEHIKAANDVHHFKSKMNLWSGPECHCGNCILCYIYRLWRLSCIYTLLTFYLPFIGLYYTCMVFPCLMLHLYLCIITIAHLYIFIILIVLFSRLIATTADAICLYPERL